MINNDKIEISVIILTYNTDKTKVIDTINSIIMQEDLTYEIIIADDGSYDNNFKYLEKYLNKKCSKSFRLLEQKENRGTVKNFLEGISYARGKYVKGIGAGDLFYEKDTLKKWYFFMENYNARVSFCDALYFCKNEKSEIEFLKIKDSPQRPQIYLRHNIQQMKRYFLIYNDLILGAKFLVERSLLEEYLKKIESCVKLAEDNIFRIMLCDDIPFYYFEDIGICYEYGVGIWSSKNNKYSKQLQEDWRNTNAIIDKKISKNIQKYRMNLNTNEKQRTFSKMKKCILQFDACVFKITTKIFPRYTDGCR